MHERSRIEIDPDYLPDRGASEVYGHRKLVAYVVIHALRDYSTALQKHGPKALNTEYLREIMLGRKHEMRFPGATSKRGAKGHRMRCRSAYEHAHDLWSAAEFLMSESPRPMGFRWCCEMLGIDHEAVKYKLIRAERDLIASIEKAVEDAAKSPNRRSPTTSHEPTEKCSGCRGKNDRYPILKLCSRCAERRKRASSEFRQREKADK